MTSLDLKGHMRSKALLNDAPDGWILGGGGYKLDWWALFHSGAYFLSKIPQAISVVDKTIQKWIKWYFKNVDKIGSPQ